MKLDRYEALLARSDEHLISRRLRCIAPEIEEDILDEAPADVSGAIIQSYYELNADQPKVRCRQCREPQWKANHRNGYVIRLAGGMGLLVGSSCGAKHFGANWASLTRQFSQRQSRQSYLRRRERIIGAWTHVNAELVELLQKPWARRYDIGVRSFTERLPILREMLTQHLTTVGADIYQSQQVRDIRAEENRRGSSEEHIYTTVSRSIGRIAGTDFATATPLLEKTMAAAIKRLARYVQRLTAADTDTLNDKELSKLVRDIEQHANKFNASLASLHSLRAFVSADNLILICKWASASAKGQGTYRFDGSGIEWQRDNGHFVRWAVPLTDIYKAPALQRLLARE